MKEKSKKKSKTIRLPKCLEVVDISAIHIAENQTTVHLPFSQLHKITRGYSRVKAHRDPEGRLYLFMPDRDGIYIIENPTKRRQHEA